ncbi:aminomethyl transferase family protein [Microbacterium sp. SORGH_AS_0862]|uniref:aminomethyl transferase family protein n=1 Tax=Microbacterium sp. SORGH_AS_0862 TaxID=3041789 RepID=UPI00278FBD56|nr:aminomethyl transferase family protein [Microbacterium sp. SORGH_AS_0862]MDQ1204818.1 vanillate/3-O-methylgallate O-demethylase [Microbacterium sp. SORGH_AS_0862]
MTTQSLESLLTEAGGPLRLLRAHKYARPDARDEFQPQQIIPVIPGEFSLWERETRAWRERVALFDQTHHMSGLFLSGPDAMRLLSDFAINDFTTFRPNSARQIVCVTERGDMIGDGIVFHLAPRQFSVFGAGFVQNWLMYQAQTGDYDVEARYDRKAPVYPNGFAHDRPDFRYQIQGPRAAALIEKLNGGPLGDVKFFHMTEITIGGVRCRALRHGMAGVAGLEIWGPYEKRETVRDAIVAAGREFELELVGGQAYLIGAIESGWYQAVLPAIYEGEEMRAYREWLPANAGEGMIRLSGSLAHDRVEGYYRSPFDLGYDRLIHADHDFYGRDALLRRAADPRLTKVTLQWDPEDAAALLREMLTPGGRDVRFLHLPVMCDKLDKHYDTLTVDGRSVGNSAYTAYTANERSLLSMALVDDTVRVGDEVVIGWGELGGGYDGYRVEPTDIVPIRAIVSPAPYSRVAREDYRRD